MALSIPHKLKAMFAQFLRRRRLRRYIWTPAVDFSERRIILAMMTFGH